MDRAAELFVDEDVFAEVGDMGVDAQGKLADQAGAGVALDDGLKELLVGADRGLD